ncbi:hypothetical protein RD792_006353 [Penstemon davidsonii]|uniref:Protein kinase domain-containing protein n=1 Tax=Penstemon davidsonii TaxID=160366 RepID=A0ABR0DCQ2_9LAMI|nr:hypothetical protein RD792_006353 [Penstemon davidsonii]
MLEVLSLSFNELKGNIPGELWNLSSLQWFDLARNSFTGTIPPSFGNLSNLMVLELSENKIQGEIPCEIGFLSSLTNLLLGMNNLNGEMPQSIFNLSRLEELALDVNELSPPSNSPLGLAHERVSYYELLRATNNLDQVNLIGRGSLGSVYKGIFSNGTTVAVKVFDLDVQGALKSFDIKCQILRSIRHINLVKVVTSCSNLDFKALVLEYMHNGNLNQWLYSPNYFLSIAQRLRIMIDIESAIEYLHRGYSSPIVHCDLKPSNILLDEDMVAPVGDFGIAMLLTNDRRMEMTKTLGTIGYMAPEYGYAGLVSTSVDVYSYGILLMETFTRKKPTDEMFLGQLILRSWVFGSLPNGIAKIVDVDLLNVDRENIRAKHEMLLTLIIECTVDTPEERLNIKDVLIRLKKIKIRVQEQQNRGRLNE